jgi:hypothetical protein
MARRRGPAKKKDDAEDARICCLLALDSYLELRKLIPHGETGAELRAIAHVDERAARDERRIGNRLGADLLAVFPAALTISGGDLGAPVFLGLLEHWPSAADLAMACREEIEDFARSRRHGWPIRFAGQVSDAIAAPQLPVRPELARAKAGAIRLAAVQLLLLRAQRKAWERRMGELLLGAPRTGRDKTPKDPDPGKAFRAARSI